MEVDVAVILLGSSSEMGPPEMGISFGKTGSKKLYEKTDATLLGISGKPHSLT